MASPAQPLTEMFWLAAAAFAEGAGTLAETSALDRDAARPVLAFGHQAITSGFLQVEALCKRYAAAPEASGAPARPILNDPQFRAAAIACASQLEEAVSLLGVPAKRMAAAMRRWVGSENPAEARTLAMQADAAVRLSKMRAGRAA